MGANRMRAEALARIHDAAILEASLQEEGGSSAHLRILGFEILLKCALVCCNVTPPKTHKYEKLWNQLPPEARSEILASANARIPGLQLDARLSALLGQYQWLFEKARYPYELLDGWTETQVSEYTEYWLSLGAPTDEADTQYHPEELVALTHGLAEFTKARCAAA